MQQRLTAIATFALRGILIGMLFAPSTSFSATQSSVRFSTQETVQFTQEVEQTTDQTTAPQQGGFVVEQEIVSYAAAPFSQNPYPRLAAGNSYQFMVTVENVGSTSWNPSVVFLGTARPRDRVPSFLREDVVGHNPSGWSSENRVRMQFDDDGFPMGDTNANGMIDPEETATFSFWYSVPETMKDGLYREYFNLLAEHVTWFPDLGIFWEITVDSLPHARFVDQNAYPPQLAAGDTYEFWVRFENTGLLPWKDAGATPVHLGTDRPMDRIPGFLREGPTGSDSGWVPENGNRVKLDRDPDTGELIGDANGNDQIDPSEVARFRFSYKVPPTMESGGFKEYFRPVMDNRDYGWTEDFGVFWQIDVDNIALRPASVTIEPAVNKLSISWTPSAEATSYKLRYRPVGGDVFSLLDFPPSITSTTIDVAGGQDFEVGVASVDAEGVSPFTSSVAHVESPAEVQARIVQETARQERIAEERRLEEEQRKPAEEPPIVTGPPAEPEQPSDWRQFWLTLLVILGAAGLATAGYYGYEWWVESRARGPRPPRPSRPKAEPPRREGPPKPPAPPTTRW